MARLSTKSIGGEESPTRRGIKPAQPNQAMQVELIRRRYIVQNKSLAKTTSLMMTKVSNLETRISELVQENIRLRSKNVQNEQLYKRQLEQNLHLVEEMVSAKFSELVECVAKMRKDTGMVSTEIFHRRESPSDLQEEFVENLEVDEELENQSETHTGEELRDSSGERIEKVTHVNRQWTSPPFTDLTIREENEPPFQVYEDNPPKRKPKVSKPKVEKMPQPTAPRSTRRKSMINYALPSLRKKMRRENEKLVGAVDGMKRDVPIDLTGDECISKNPSEEPPLDVKTEEVSMEESDDEEGKPTEEPPRQPLSSVSVNNIRPRPEMSVFDFTDDPENLILPTSKRKTIFMNHKTKQAINQLSLDQAKPKRKTQSNRRRYSMIM